MTMLVSHKQMTMIQNSNESQSQSVQSSNFDKVKKIENQCEMDSTFHAKMADIICSNFPSQISQNIFTP